MSHQFSIWRAAQLVGVARGVLQQQVREGALALSDEGLVSVESLLRLYPQARLEESGLMERVTQIREEAFGRRVRERLLPSQEVLAQRLFLQSEELGDVRRHLQRYHELVIEMQKTLRQEISRQPENSTLRNLEKQITQGLARVLATESVDLLEVLDDMLKVVSAQVTIRPSGHQFMVEGHANLLQSGLHSGLKLNYGCGNGSCGMCKVRVISGEVSKTQHFDYPLSQTEKSQGYTLMCCHTAASSELTIEMLEAEGPEDIPEQNIVAQVRTVNGLSNDTLMLHLQTPRTHRLRFLAGQFVRLGWSVPGGGDVHGTFPIASCPCDDRNLLFHIPRNEADALTKSLFAGALRHGTQVNVLGPTGEFVLAESTRPLVFAACDHGFAPCNSLIEHAFSRDISPSISLFWLSTLSDGHYLSNQCRAWSEALDQFEYELVSNKDVAAGAHEMAAAMRADIFDIDCDFYLAGPVLFIDTLREELRASGVPQTQIYTQYL